MKFGTHHFPVGTVFEINENVRFGRKAEYTVTGIARNGVRSYVLTTGEFREHTGEQVYNIEHVKRVIRRGSGQVVIDHGYHGVGPTSREKLLEEQRMMEITGPIFGGHDSDGEPKVIFTPRKRNYNTGSLQAVLMLEIQKLGQPGLTVDYSRMITALFNQSWCFPVREKWFQIVCVNKKRLRRWLRQNVNRFLCKLDELVKLEEEEVRLDYERDCRDWEDDYLRSNNDFPEGHVTDIKSEDLSLYQTALANYPRTQEQGLELKLPRNDKLYVRSLRCDPDVTDLSEFWAFYYTMRDAESKELAVSTTESPEYSGPSFEDSDGEGF
jgi:hypothetical protein